jgi:hypothetical protein
MCPVYSVNDVPGLYLLGSLSQWERVGVRAYSELLMKLLG